MIRLLCCLCFVLFSVIGNNALHAQDKNRKANPHATGEDICKHYTGTIGDKNVVLDLRYGYQGASNYGGSRYYYADKAGTYGLIIPEPESFDHNIVLTAEEAKENHDLNNDDLAPDRSNLAAKWEFTISGDSLTGTRQDFVTRQTEDIRLAEDYKKSTELDMVFITDKLPTKDDPEKTWAMASYMLVQPSFNTVEDKVIFIKGTALNFLGGLKLGAYYWSAFPPAYTKKFFDDIVAENDTPIVEKDYYMALMPTYNDNGFLVLERMIGLGYDSISYLCMDVRNKKQLDLKDILNVDNAKLSKLLENALREKYKLDKNKSLNTWLLVSKIPVTKNFALGHKGIYFTYNSGELYKSKPGSWNARNELSIFLPYDQLQSMLKPEFKKRLAL